MKNKVFKNNPKKADFSKGHDTGIPHLLKIRKGFNPKRMWHLAYDQIVKENNIREKIKRSKLWTYLKYERYVYLYAKKICSSKEISMGEREFLINFEKAYNLTDIIYLRTTGLERVEILNRRSKTGKDHQLWENIYCYKKLNIKEGKA